MSGRERPLAPPPLHRKLLLSLLASLPGLLACGDSARSREAALAQPGWSLLARAPDAEQSQPGVLEPDRDAQWGGFGAIGWEERTDRDGRRRFVWSLRKASRLVLPAGSQRDRSLGLVLWCPPAPEGADDAQTLIVRLNDAVLSVGEVGSERRELELPAPAAFWRVGDNVLELEVEALRRLPGDAGAPETGYGVALERVVYDAPALVEADLERGTLRLSPDTGARYRIEDLGGLDLHLAGEASGAGELSVAVLRIDAPTGEAREVLRTYDLSVQPGALERGLTLPEGGGCTLELSLAWQGADGLRLDELRVLEREPRERFPIILLAVDTLAARHMSLYGYGRDTTPHLSELAQDAVVFEHCVTNGTWTLPSFMSVMTGLYPDASRLADETPGMKMWEVWYLADNRWTLAESLRAAGFRTAAFVDTIWLSERFHFEQGFDVFDTSAGENDKADPRGGIARVSRLALEHLDDADDGRPDFLFLHCFDVHGPYSPAPAFRGRFQDRDAAEEPADLRPAGGVANAYRAIPRYVAAAEFPDGVPERVSAGLITARYDEGIATTDAAIGELFDELKRRGIYDRALIVVFADHGETDGDGPLFYGHGALTEDVAHVPLIVKLPGNQGAGRRVAQSVQLVDLYPTLAELAGIAPGARGHGRSLVGALRGEELPPRPILTESGIMRQVAIQHEGWKLTVQVPGEPAWDAAMLTFPGVPDAYLQEHFPRLVGRTLTDELLAELRSEEGYWKRIENLRALALRPVVGLFHLATDPEERTNLAAREPERLARMQAVLLEELQRRDQARALARAPATSVSLPAEVEAELSKLGYVDDG